jgi:hypothetical protein
MSRQRRQRSTPTVTVIRSVISRSRQKPFYMQKIMAKEMGISIKTSPAS